MTRLAWTSVVVIFSLVVNDVASDYEVCLNSQTFSSNETCSCQRMPPKLPNPLSSLPSCESCVLQEFPLHLQSLDGRCSSGNNLRCGTTCELGCEAGYDLIINSTTAAVATISCNNGSLTGELPSCTLARCASLPTSPEYGNVTCTNGTEFGSECTFSCFSDYQLTGSQTRTCNRIDDSAEWSGVHSNCIVTNCATAPTPPHGLTSCTNGTLVGSVCNITCSPDYLLSGSTTTTCTESENAANWSTNDTTCTVSHCATTLSSLNHGDVKCTNGRALGSTCNITCSTDYRLYGSSTRTCTESGNYAQWNGSETNCTVTHCSEPLTSPTHGYMTCTNQTEVGSRCDFSCSINYRLNGSVKRYCVESNNSAHWNGHGDENSCEVSHCASSLIPPANGSVNCTNDRGVGSVCTFGCSTDYQLYGSSSRNCSVESNVATWSGSNPNCTVTHCTSALTTPTYGNMLCTNDRGVGSVCTFNCSDNYRLSGDTTRTCNNTGNSAHWSGLEASCTVTHCNSTLTSPSNGSVSCTNGRKVGSNCTFNCSPNYWLRGSSTRICIQSNNSATWNGLETNCIVPQCTSPLTPPAHGNVSCPSATVVGSVCTYTCLPDYRLIGSITRTCTQARDHSDTAFWNGTSATCTVSHCSTLLPSPDHGNVSCTKDRAVGSECSFNCSTNYELQGSTGRTCVESGNSAHWSGSVTYCTVSHCSTLLPSPTHGNVSCTADREVGSECSFNCSTNYELQGSTTRTCEESGNSAYWSGSVTNCKVSHCSSLLAPPDNGNVHCTLSREVGSVCTFNCSKDYRLSGSTTRNCTESDNSASWDGSQTTCTVAYCSAQLTSPTNGSVSCSHGREVGSTCSFSCYPDYRLYGSSNMTCVESGNSANWDGSETNCTVFQCGSLLPPPSNGTVICTYDEWIGSECTFSCDHDYRLYGSSTRICVESGNSAYWDGTETNCTVFQCGSLLAPPSNGTVTCTDDSEVGSKCTFSCYPDYRLYGSLKRTCLESQNSAYWSGSETNCTVFHCRSQLAPPSNGNITCTHGREVGSECFFSCSTNYELRGATARTCTESGNSAHWNGSDTECIATQCASLLAPPANGFVTCTHGRAVGSQCTFTCSANYRLSGSSKRTCIASGDSRYWIGDRTYCTVSHCPSSLQEPNNGNVTCTDGRKVGSVCTFKCSVNFQLSGSPTRSCETAGKWSGSETSCKASDCNSSLGKPENGIVSCTNGRKIQSQCTFSCSKNYRLNGSSTWTCTHLRDSTYWNDSKLNCLACSPTPCQENEGCKATDTPACLHEQKLHSMHGITIAAIIAAVVALCLIGGAVYYTVLKLRNDSGVVQGGSTRNTNTNCDRLEPEGGESEPNSPASREVLKRQDHLDPCVINKAYEGDQGLTVNITRL